MKKVLSFLILTLLVLSIKAGVKNPDKPVKGEWDFQLKKVWDVDMAGKEVIGRPRQVLVADSGNVIVYDNKFTINRIFTPDGKFLKSFGKRGEGPGEIKFQTWAYTVDNKVIVKIKTAQDIEGDDDIQMSRYLEAINIETGVLLNFGVNPEFKLMSC